MKQVVAERKDIAFYIILYPLPNHKEAYKKSKSILCEQSLEMLEDAFAKKTIPDPSCETNEVDDNIKLAKKLGISGTPALIFPDGVVRSGFRKAEAIISFIDKK
jgi:thiol:disulfide interchange protein DsbC